MDDRGHNLLLTIEYDGTAFSGWQVQPDVRTVQGEIENAAEVVLRHPVRLTAAGRTDAGVHARGQAANVRTPADITPSRLKQALNGLLPRDIVIHDVREVPTDFNARFDAASRSYRYTVSEQRIAIGRDYAWRVRHSLSRELLVEAARSLDGECDIRGFSKAGDDEDCSTVIFDAEWRFDSHCIIFDIRAIRFFHHAVRSMVGTMVDIARGRLDPGTMDRILEERNRSLAGQTAPASGLCLMSVDYGEVL